MAIKIVVEGLEKVLDAMKKSAEETNKAVARALYEEALVIMADSKDNYCPVVTGNLKASGHVDEPIGEGRSVRIPLGYGGAAAPYALAVHENPNAGKTEHGSQVGQWKYLETPMLKASKGLSERVGGRVRKILGSRR